MKLGKNFVVLFSIDTPDSKEKEYVIKFLRLEIFRRKRSDFAMARLNFSFSFLVVRLNVSYGLM